MDKYRVNDKETLDDIARKFNLSIDELLKTNDLLSDKLFEGQLVNIPSNKETFINYIVKKNDTLNSLSIEYDIDIDILTKINGLEDNEYLYENQEILIPNKNVKVYLTNDNDKLNEIITKENLKLDLFMKNNKSIYLLPGQLLIIKK